MVHKFSLHDFVIFSFLLFFPSNFLPLHYGRKKTDDIDKLQRHVYVMKLRRQ